ncbi:PilW family protein [Aquisalimonas sp.]|uniref:PilW family protein n=1 Tax=Aquisalimonas sp. TaxID=1872621 RepID=UPI0025BEBA8C|nr:PilW family protein [Aquisalimonas sp.]
MTRGSFTPSSLPVARRQGGLTLVELMVALVIGLILTAGAYQIYLSGKQSFNTQETLARMQETGRYVTDLLVSDLRRAGYWGGNADIEQVSGDPGPANWAPTCPSDGTWPRMIERRVFDLSSALDGTDCFDNYLRGDILAVRYAASDVLDDDSLLADALYMRSSLFESRLMRGDQPEGANILPAVGADTAATRPLRAHAYYIGSVNGSASACAGEQAMPALWRAGLQPWQDDGEAIAGVEHLKLRFLEAGVDEYVDAGAVGDWSEVVAVRTWVLVRAECPEPALSNTTTYTMGNEQYQPNDNFRRHLYVNTVSLRNR